MGTAEGMRDDAVPSAEWLSRSLFGLMVLAAWIIAVTKLSRPASRSAALRWGGVAKGRIAKALFEIERKVFHVAGVLIPLWYHVMVEHLGFTETFCATVAAGCSAAVWAIELGRLRYPAVQRLVLASPMGRIMRDREKTQLTGSPFFVLGCTVAIALFPKPIAITSILHLVLGDMAAALFGVSFGGETVVVKLGRQGQKSVEGSLAMFAVCFTLTLTVFAGVHLCEYVAFVTAAAATLCELWSEDLLGINDNLTIPFVSSVTMAWSLHRIARC